MGLDNVRHCRSSLLHVVGVCARQMSTTTPCCHHLIRQVLGMTGLCTVFSMGEWQLRNLRQLPKLRGRMDWVQVPAGRAVWKVIAWTHCWKDRSCKGAGGCSLLTNGGAAEKSRHEVDWALGRVAAATYVGSLFARTILQADASSLTGLLLT